MLAQYAGRTAYLYHCSRQKYQLLPEHVSLDICSRGSNPLLLLWQILSAFLVFAVLVLFE